MCQSHFVQLLCAALFTFATFGCASSQQPSQPAPQTQSPPPSQDHGRYVTGSDLVLVNNSAEPIYYIQMSSSANPSWGDDLLGADVLMVGASFRITGISAGLWDLRVIDSSGNKKEYHRQNFDGRNGYHIVIDSYGWSQ